MRVARTRLGAATAPGGPDSNRPPLRPTPAESSTGRPRPSPPWAGSRGIVRRSGGWGRSALGCSRRPRRLASAVLALRASRPGFVREHPPVALQRVVRLGEGAASVSAGEVEGRVGRGGPAPACQGPRGIGARLPVEQVLLVDAGLLARRRVERAG